MITLNLEKSLNAAEGVLDLQINCNLQKGNLYVLYGVSGAGKTSILRMLAGLMHPDKGRIEVNQQLWLDTKSKVFLKPQQRNIGFVFQEYALFPNMTVRQNLQYALGKKKQTEIIDELIEMTGLAQLQDRKPDVLSGGQQQRVALARALVRQPEILMLDEPLSALDQAMRAKLQDYIMKLHQKYGHTTLLVSHDIAEIVKMADYIFVLNEGKIVQQGNPLEVFSSTHKKGQYRALGTVLEISHDEDQPIIIVWVDHQPMKIVASDEEIKDIQVGERVVIFSEDFHPKILKLQTRS